MQRRPAARRVDRRSAVHHVFQGVDGSASGIQTGQLSLPSPQFDARSAAVVQRQLVAGAGDAADAEAVVDALGCSPRDRAALSGLGLPGRRRGYSQFSVIRPGTRVNSARLSVTTTAPNARPCAAIQKSLAPIGVPRRSRWARTCAYVRLTRPSSGATSILSTSFARRAALRSR